MEADKEFSSSVDDLMARKRLAGILLWKLLDLFLKEISEALKRLEKKCHSYLDMFVKTGENIIYLPLTELEDWRIFKDGFLHLNHYFRPEDLVEIRTCNLGESTVSSLYPDQQKVRN